MNDTEAAGELRVLDYRQNPFGLVYEGAITENEPGKVNIHPVTYTLHGLKIAANVYTPANYDPNGTFPAIAVAHPNGGVKEQVAGRYAQRLAEQGYITITADAAYQGHSEGEPRNVDKPYYRIDDVHGMADFIAGYPGVDVDRLDALGICGGGYTLKAAQSDKRFKAIATVSMFNMGRVHRQEMGDPEELLAAVGAQRTREAHGGEVQYLHPITEVHKNTPPLMAEFIDYYWTPRGQHPRMENRYTLESAARLINFFPLAQIETVSPRPILMIVGENAESKYFSDEAYEKAAEPKELFIVPGAGHVDLYDRPEYMEVSMAKLDDFFAQHLGK